MRKIERLVVRHSKLPLSFAQQRLWLVDRLLPEGSAYNVAHALRLAGDLDVAALRWSLNEVVGRHEALRTTFGMEDGEPVQMVAAELKVPLEVEDLRGLPAGEREAEAQRRAGVEAQTAFDLARGPLLRARLLRLAETEHWLLLTLHHIVTDGWSMGVLWRELSVLYEAHRQGRPSPLPELPVQYADYAVWQREWLQGEVLQKQLDYWKATLADLPVLELPTDRVRPAVASYRGEQVRFELDAELTQGLKRLAREERATLFMVLLAAFQVLLYRYGGQEDVVVGVPIAGRVRPELEGLIGFFVNTLVMRGDMSGEPSFREYVGRVRERALDAYAHQDVPFEKLVEELQPQRDPSRNPLFQALLVFQNAPSGALYLPGVDVRRVEGIRHGSAKFDLLLNLTEVAGGLHGSMEYASDLFDRSTVERLVGHFRVLLEGIVADPGRSIARLPLLTQTERHQLLVDWNDTTVDYPRDRCIHQLFEDQVRQSPDAVAVVFGDRHLTYGELNRRANQLAHHLRTLGVGPEALVALAAERSLDLVIGLLGILKAGGPYVPLDPSYPRERLAYMLQDTQAPVLLTQLHLLERLPRPVGCTVCIDRDWSTIARQRDTDPDCTTTVENLAYVMYTSGSTGQPKGVMVEQRTIANCLGWVVHRYPLQPDDRVMQGTPTSFDMSVLELFMPLISGAQLVLMAPGAHRSASEILDCALRQRVTVFQAVPSMLAAIVDGGGLSGLRLLRRVFVAGETLGTGLVERFHAQSPAELINGYGPTETFYSTFWTCRRDETKSAIPIGRPVGGTCAHVLDAELQPTPVGVPGDLYFDGIAVARGYLNRPDLTAERFIVSPFAGQPGSRMYKTGDRARYTIDGNLEFLGRRDDQVKIRGFRIELGEIEAALGRHPAVAMSVVVAHEYAPGDLRLVAYAKAAGEAVPAPAALREFLQATLPSYMVPASYVFVDRFPRTPSGKVDRNRLPRPDKGVGAAQVNGAVLRPRSQLDFHLQKLFAKVLGLESVGLQDDFFALGGHSLAAARLVDEIEKHLGRRIPLDTLWYNGATVERIADLLQRDEATYEWPLLIPLQAGRSGLPLFCVHTIGGNLFHYEDLVRALSRAQPVFGLQARGVYGKDLPRRSVEAIASDCIDAMRLQQPRGPFLLAGYSSGGCVAFEMARQLTSEGERVGLLALIDSFAPNVKPGRGGRGVRLHNLRRSASRELQERVYHGALTALGLSHLRDLRRIGEAQRWALWSYKPKPYVGSAHQFLADVSAARVDDPTLGWGRFVQGGMEVHRVSGTHASIMKPPQVAEIGAVLQRLIDATDGRAGRSLFPVSEATQARSG